MLPGSRTATRADWTRLSKDWRARLDDQIVGLIALRDSLDSCIGCGCLITEAMRDLQPRGYRWRSPDPAQSIYRSPCGEERLADGVERLPRQRGSSSIASPTTGGPANPA